MRIHRLRAAAIAYLMRTDKRKPCGSACPIRLEAGIDVPELAFPRSAVLHRGGPLPAEANFVQPVSRGENRFCRERSEEHTSELQSLRHLVCRLLLEKKK